MTLEAAIQALPDGYVIIKTEPTDEVLRQMLAVEFPAVFRKHLRNPLNGPKTSADTEELIKRVTQEYKVIVRNRL